MQNILVFGGSGQLGQCIKKVAGDRGIDNIVYLSSAEGNILDLGALRDAFEEHQPAFVINCAAYTAVDKAEDDIDNARAINKTGAHNLALACAENHATLIHISTDFVFGSNTPLPLNEEDDTDPIGVYGLTKLEGEQEIAKALPQHFIVRTSWLYSEYANNFMKTMLKLAVGRDELRIIADQVGTPTYAIDLAGHVLDIIASGSEAYGVYHYSNEGVASWYDFAKAIFDIAGVTIKVTPIRTSDYPTRAKRPAWSVLDKAKIKNTFGIKIPYWRDSLILAIKALN